MGVPQKLLLELVAHAEDRLARPPDADSAAVRHLRRYLGILPGPDGIEDDPPLIAHVSVTLADLTALVRGAGRDGAELAGMRGLRAARLQEIVAEIRAGFADPAFSPQRLATKLRISARYIQRLLQETGSSFTDRVLELRLQRARAMLMDPRHDGFKIGEIASLCGFNEVPYFNRCFRRRFAAAPSEFRGRGRHGP